MKKFAYAAFVSAAVLALTACGSSDDAQEQATPDNVEMPAEEQLNTVEAVPVPDDGAAAASATSTAPADPNAGAAAADSAANAAAAAADFEAAGGEGADKAVEQAEKKM